MKYFKDYINLKAIRCMKRFNFRSRVLEVGCGTGELLELISREYESEGIDLSDEAISICKEKGLKTQQASLFDITAKFNSVICVDVIEHNEDECAFVEHLYKILNEDGRLFIMAPAGKMMKDDITYGHYRRYSKEAIIELLKSNKFVIESVEMFGYPILHYLRIFMNLIYKPEANKDINPQTRILKSFSENPFDKSIYAAALRTFPIISKLFLKVLLLQDLFANGSKGFGVIVVAKKPSHEDRHDHIASKAKPRCALCNSENIEIAFSPTHKNGERLEVKKANFFPTVSDFGIFHKLGRCKNCDILFSILDNKEPNIERLYSEAVDERYLSQASERNATFKRILSYIKTLIPSGSRLLDVGCSYGFFLKLAREWGMSVCGVDMNEDACRYCKESLGLDIFCGDIQKAVFPENHFDIITIIETIEHIYDLRSFISQVYRILKPGGILYIVTPNINSLSARLFGYRWWSYRRMHLYYFSKNVLNKFLRKNGFSVICSNPYKKTFKINYLIDKIKTIAYGRNRFFYYLLSSLSNMLINKNLRITTSIGDIAVLARKI